MAGGKQVSGAKREKTLKSPFKAPTVGLEDVVFDYGAGMRPGISRGMSRGLPSIWPAP